MMKKKKGMHYCSKCKMYHRTGYKHGGKKRRGGKSSGGKNTFQSGWPTKAVSRSSAYTRGL